ncbi:MAG: hypothetical protein D6791_16195 [Chloroflexi bacterium]|nr:MAG: hypothetical protein D6791_16195 [Chloroflexota bacterium]
MSLPWIPIEFTAVAEGDGVAVGVIVGVRDGVGVLVGVVVGDGEGVADRVGAGVGVEVAPDTINVVAWR